MARTRADVRRFKPSPLSGAQLDKILEAFTQRFDRLNDIYLKEMGNQLREIGMLPPSDVHRLQQIRRMNSTLASLERRIAKEAAMSAADVEKILTRCAESDARIASKILGVPDIGKVKDNPYLMRILEAQVRETAGLMENLSNTTVDNSFYRKAVDEAVQAVQSGVEDYNTAIRRVVREAGQHGLRIRESIDGTKTRVVDYESGYSRRLDSAARMNVLDGVRHMNQDILDAVGDRFGADGIEIDAHMLCAEDHLPYQGRQYSLEEFERIQSSLRRPFGEWNCRHTWHKIILGVSPPNYTGEQLAEMERYSTEKVTIDGRTKTRYQWSQELRRTETAIRQQKDTANLAKASGDKELADRSRGNVLRLNRYYRDVAGQSGLKPEFNRTAVDKDVQSTKKLTHTSDSGTINKASVAIKHTFEKESELGRFRKALQSDSRIDSTYYDTLKKRFSHGSDKAKAAFNKFTNGADAIVDNRNLGTAHFDPATKKIYLNSLDDVMNPRGNGVTFFHEHGHLIDDASGYKSHDKTFRSLLDKDHYEYARSYGKKNGIRTWDKVDAAIQKDLNTMRSHSAVSDILEGITAGNIRGVAGHGSNYWSFNSICEEAFAHMYECQFDTQRHDEMKKYFPEALEYFEKTILNEVIK